MDRFFVEPEHLNLDDKTLYIDGEDVVEKKGEWACVIAR